MARPMNLTLGPGISDNNKMPPTVPDRRSRSIPYTRVIDSKEARNYSFYFGKIPNDQVEELLKPHMDRRGTFLLRDSNTEDGVLTISVVENPKHIYHFKVNCTSHLYEVTDHLKFRKLSDLLTHFEINEVPGEDASQLKLVYPVHRHSTRKRSPSNMISPISESPPESPSRSPRNLAKVSPPRPPRKRSSDPAGPKTFLDSRDPVPIPEPGREPVYFSNDHIYCRAEDLTRSKIDDLMELCKISDLKYKKCTCGLYMDESQLVDNWMMHIDRQSSNDNSGSGRLFFVNSLTNETTWMLPESAMSLLESQQLDKYRHVQKLLKDGGSGSL